VLIATDPPLEAETITHLPDPKNVPVEEDTLKVGGVFAKNQLIPSSE
jgi:hypothetical protein